MSLSSWLIRTGDSERAMTADLDLLNRAIPANGQAPSIASDAEVDRGRSGSGVSAASKGWVAVGATAAGIALGVLVAAAFGMGSDFRGGEGGLFAGGTLAQNLANEKSGGGAVGPSFWSRDGSFCRVFSRRSFRGAGLTGIACRENGGWRVRIVTESDTTGALPAEVRAVMENLIVGTPLDPAAEQQARRQGWRPG
jgi:hypothetical protein